MTILRVTTLFSGASTAGGGVNQMYFDPAGAGAAAAASSVLAFWNTSPSTQSSDTTWAVQPEVEELDEASGELTGVIAVTGGGGSGTGTTDRVPPMAQLLVRFRTGVFGDGRELRGRVNVPGLLDGHNDLGRPSSGVRSVWQTGANTLVAATGDLVVYRRKREARAAVPPGPGHPNGLPALSERAGSFARVTTATLWDQWAILRSRRD